jgi:hypothetical protein
MRMVLLLNMRHMVLLAVTVRGSCNSVGTYMATGDSDRADSPHQPRLERGAETLVSRFKKLFNLAILVRFL